MLSDIEIATDSKMLPITQIANSLNINPDHIDLYGKYKAKVTQAAYNSLADKKNGKLILVTAINPTPAGEGKTTTTVGLGQAMKHIGKNAIIALREPSLGPVFGVKGGAAGGGYSQVVPMEDINLHFTGDMHAITSANNLLCALLDNSIQQGNKLNIDPRTVAIKRCLDINDRALRDIVIGMGGKTNGVVRQDGFILTVASEVMAILCLCSDLSDLKRRLGNILVAYTYDNTPIYASDLKAEGAMATLLRDAINPNLVQTLEGTPALVHGGPFANIAHGCNSLRATKLALKLADYTITEAGFGSDLGAQKFLDIKCVTGGLVPSCIVIVATARALKYNGGVNKNETKSPNMQALKSGIVNLGAHINGMRLYSVPVMVAINVFDTDDKNEIAYIKQYCTEQNCECVISDVFAAGGEGGKELAKCVVSLCEQDSTFTPLYKESQTVKEKIELIAQKIYGASGVNFSAKAQNKLKKLTELGCDYYPVCIAKTPYSLSDDAKLLGRPSGFTIHINDINLSAGAGFVVALAGSVMTMPGLPPVPSAEVIDIGQSGNISGLF